MPARTVVFVLAAVLLATPSAVRADRQPLRDAGHAAWTVAEDAWALATAPTRWTRADLIELGGVLAVGGVLFAFDEPIDRFAARNAREPGFDQVRRTGDRFDRLGLMGRTWYVYAGTMVLGYAANLPKVARMGGEILEAQYLSGSLRNAGKLILGRRRPYEGRGAYWFEINGGTSFPSGHAASAWSAVEVIRLHVDRWWVTAPLYAIAGSISLERILNGEHWASDVWIGTVSGIAAARFVVSRHERPEDSSRARLVPTVSPDGAPALALVGAW